MSLFTMFGGPCSGDPCGVGNPCGGCQPSNIRALAIISFPLAYSASFTSTIFNDALAYAASFIMSTIPFGQAAFVHCSTSGVLSVASTSAANLTTLLSQLGEKCASSGAAYSVCSTGFAFGIFRMQQNGVAGKFNIKAYVPQVCGAIIPLFSGIVSCCIDATDTPVKTSLPSCCAVTTPSGPNCSGDCACISLTSGLLDLPVPSSASMLPGLIPDASFSQTTVGVSVLLTLGSNCL